MHAHPHGPKLVYSVGLLVVSLIPLTISIPSPTLSQDSQSYAYRLSLGFHQVLDETSQKTIMLSSSLHAQQLSLTVSGFGSLSSVVICWSFTRSLFQLYPCTYCRQEKMGEEGFVGGLLYSFLLWKSYLAIQAPYAFLVEISVRFTPIDFQKHATSQRCTLLFSVLSHFPPPHF